MKRTAMLGMALLAALAIGGADAISVSASEHEFIANKAGKVTSKAANTQVFKTGAGKVECTAATGEGEVKEGKQTTNKEVINYSSCTGFSGKVTMSAVDFEFNANGSAKIEKNVLVMMEGASCHVTIPAQTVESVSYGDEPGGKVKATASVSDIHSYGSGGACGTTEESSGVYTGSILAEPGSGNTLEWK
ncbi:MAG TPA: hypothetical protein VKV16_04830 [Solirubrobacteraceae bacterium]|nr:hypothetical protein [Solirubrobacteraceae bacterium]